MPGHPPRTTSAALVTAEERIVLDRADAGTRRGRGEGIPHAVVRTGEGGDPRRPAPSPGIGAGAPSQVEAGRMAISALEVGRRADALVQLMRSGGPLEGAREIMQGVAAEDVPAVARAFAAGGWEDAGEPVPERGVRLDDWLAGLRDEP